MGFQWVFNIWLYLLFVFNPQGYAQDVAAGYPCYALVQLAFAGPGDPGPMPPCWYDPEGPPQLSPVLPAGNGRRKGK